MPALHACGAGSRMNPASRCFGRSFQRFLLSAATATFAVLLLVPSASGEYGDVVLDSKKESMAKAGVGPVVFPHWFHRIRFKCKVCHEDIFVMQRGANNVSMKEIVQGRSCGVCHNGIVAWEPLYCERCHAEPGAKGPAPAAAPKK